jgi:hypothetical protein
MGYKNTLSTTGLKVTNLRDSKRDAANTALPTYEMPRILTYTDKQILDVLGPAQTNVYP